MAKIIERIVPNITPKQSFRYQNSVVDRFSIVVVDGNPTGLASAIGTIAFWNDNGVGKYFKKTGNGDSDWEIDNSGGGGGASAATGVFVYNPVGGTKAQISFSGKYAGMVLQSDFYGEAGNSYSVEIIGDSPESAGVTAEIVGKKITVHYESGVSTSGDVASVFYSYPINRHQNIQSEPNIYEVLTAPADNVSEIFFSNGVDGVTDETSGIYSNFNSMMTAISALDEALPKKIFFDFGSIISTIQIPNPDTLYNIRNNIEFYGMGQYRPRLDFAGDYFIGFPKRIDNLDIEQRLAGRIFKLTNGADYTCVVANSELDGAEDEYICSIEQSSNLQVYCFNYSRLDDFDFIFDDGTYSSVTIKLYQNSDFEKICIHGNTTNTVNVHIDESSSYDTAGAWAGTINETYLSGSTNFVNVGDFSFSTIYSKPIASPRFYLSSSSSYMTSAYTLDTTTFYGGTYYIEDGASISSNQLIFENTYLTAQTSALTTPLIGDSVTDVTFKNSTIYGFSSGQPILSFTNGTAKFFNSTILTNSFSVGSSGTTNLYMYNGCTIGQNSLVTSIGNIINIYHDGTLTYSSTQINSLGTINLIRIGGVQEIDIYVDGTNTTVDQAVLSGAYTHIILKAGITHTLTQPITQKITFIGEVPGTSLDISASSFTINEVFFKDLTVTIGTLLPAGGIIFENCYITVPAGAYPAPANCQIILNKNSTFSASTTTFNDSTLYFHFNESTGWIQSFSGGSFEAKNSSIRCYSFGSSAELSTFNITNCSFNLFGDVYEMDEVSEGNLVSGAFCNANKISIDGMSGKFVGQNWSIFKCATGSTASDQYTLSFKNISISVKQTGVGTAKIMDFSGRAALRNVAIQNFAVRRVAGGTINWHDISGGSGVTYKAPSSIFWTGQAPGSPILGTLVINGTTITGYGTPE